MSPYYDRVPSVEGSTNESHDEGLEQEKGGLLRRPNRVMGLNPCLSFWFLFNFVSSLLLLFFAMWLDTRSAKTTPLCRAESPPYSPVREDGAERFINTQYKPDLTYQFGEVDEVDKLWHDWLVDHDRLMKVKTEKAVEFGLPETVELFNDPGYSAYGLGVYHQMHCLSRLRKSLDPERYFPEEDRDKALKHVGHCIDVIREAIICHGDISLVYWWNSNYTYFDESGRRQHTEEFLRLSPEERATHSFAKWDTQVQCRDIDAIHAWAKKHEIEDAKYGGQIVD